MTRFGFAAIAAFALSCAFTSSNVALADDLAIKTIAGFNDVPLVVVETGNRNGPPILFIHGYSQSYLSWEKQLSDPALQAEFHLIAFDLRGHGASAKPTTPEDYRSEAWAGDVAAVIASTTTKKPVLVPWSMGGTVTASYVHHHGVEKIAGIDFVAGAVVLGETPPQSDAQKEKGKAMSAKLGGMLSPDLALNIASTRWFVGALTANPLPAAEQEHIFAYNIMTPAYARAAMFAGPPKDFSDVAAKITVPTLFTHCNNDGVVAYALSEANVKVIAGAKLSTYDGIGHAPFLEVPARFNSELAAFVRAANR